MKHTTRTTAALSAAAAGCLAAAMLAPGAGAAPAPAERGVEFDSKITVRGLSADGRLIGFNTKNLDKVKTFDITGLVADTRLIGVDYRPSNRTLYGVGDLGGVYTLKGRGAATKVGQLTTLPSGTEFGVDFNPAVDRLRIVSDTGQNLRHDVDGNLTSVDAPLNSPPAVGNTAGVTAAAYVNNDNSTDTGTLLYDINTTTDTLVTQTPANAGTLTTLGKLGVDAATSAGFDIFSTLVNGRTVSNLALAALTVKGQGRLYVVDLTSGQVDMVRGFDTSAGLVDLAARPTR